MIRLTLAGVHIEVEVGGEQLAEVEQANVDVSTKAVVSLRKCNSSNSAMSRQARQM